MKYLHAKKSSQTSPILSCISALEARYIFDAAAAATGADMATDLAAQAAAEAQITTQLEANLFEDKANTLNGLASAIVSATHSDQHSPNENIIFLDSDISTAGLDRLKTQLKSGTIIHFIDKESDALAQMATLLNGYHATKMLHVATFPDTDTAQAGVWTMGANTVDFNALTPDQEISLLQIQQGLLPDSGIIIHGQHFTQGSAGAMARDTLSQLTGVEVQTAAEMRNDSIIKNVVFADANLNSNDLATLKAGLSDMTAMHLINSDRDPLSQMQKVLGQYHNIASVHITSHGRAGTLYFGTQALDFNNLTDQQRNSLIGMRANLSDSADILIYGCDFAAGTKGEAAVHALADFTGADIAASDDTTGAERSNADWDLEVEHGTIESQLAFNDQAQQALDTTFALPTTTITNDVSGTGNLSNSTITYTITLDSGTSLLTKEKTLVENGEKGTFTHISGTATTANIYKLEVSPKASFEGDVVVSLPSDFVSNADSSKHMQTVDTIAPHITSIAPTDNKAISNTDAPKFKITVNEDIIGTPQISDFTATFYSSTNDISNVAISSFTVLNDKSGIVTLDPTGLENTNGMIDLSVTGNVQNYKDLAGNTLLKSTSVGSLTLDNTLPEVTSITPESNSAMTDAPKFKVTFNEDVISTPQSTDFTTSLYNPSSDISKPAISSVVPLDKRNWLVTLESIEVTSGDSILSLSINKNSENVKDIAGNKIKDSEITGTLTLQKSSTPDTSTQPAPTESTVADSPKVRLFDRLSLTDSIRERANFLRDLDFLNIQEDSDIIDRDSIDIDNITANTRISSIVETVDKNDKVAQQRAEQSLQNSDRNNIEAILGKLNLAIETEESKSEIQYTLTNLLQKMDLLNSENALETNQGDLQDEIEVLSSSLTEEQILELIAENAAFSDQLAYLKPTQKQFNLLNATGV